MKNTIDKMILGHNQFIGVDHMSLERGKKREKYFEDRQNILKTIHFAMEEGVGGLMLSTHDRARGITNELRNNAFFAENLNVYPLIPYIQGYVRKLNEKGRVAILKDALNNAKMHQKLILLSHAGIGYLKKDFFSILETLIDIEMLTFNGLKVKAIFLHNVLTDLAIGLHLNKVFEFFTVYIEDKYNAIPAFGTQNLPRLLNILSESDIHNPLIMAPFNKVGFQMNPSKEECERALKEYKVRILAMSTLASGFLKPDEAYEYLGSLHQIESVVVGVSSKAHARETFGTLRKLYKI